MAEDYYRRDQAGGITPPNLHRDATFVEHIVSARGKKSCYTSVSADLARIAAFGETDYLLRRARLVEDDHHLVTHDRLCDLRRCLRSGVDRRERQRAARALKLALSHREGLVDWRGFDVARVPQKEVIEWARERVQGYFERC